MNNYIEAKFSFNIPELNHSEQYAFDHSETISIEFDTAADILSAMLAEVGFECFTKDDDINILSAFIPSEKFQADELREIIAQFPVNIMITASTEEIEGRDWNAEWEKNYFQPIVVDNRCCIHSTFHTNYPMCEYDIVIDPKMAFGTGHHATTSQIIHQLLNMELDEKHVIDMGTGTGILAILSKMRCAENVVAIEIDPAAAENARENFALNSCRDIELRLGDATKLVGAKADLFIANINRNIILNDMEEYASTLNTDATMILSGFYESDIPMLLKKAESIGLKEITHTTQGDNWACLILKYNAK